MGISPDISGFVKAGKASVIFDGQFGSTGKGVAGAWVGEHNRIDWAVTNASANAGHTSVVDGKEIVTFHIPSSFLTGRGGHDTKVYIDAGAIIDLDTLEKEIADLGIYHNQIVVNPNATVILDEDREAERDTKSSQAKIASTQKGVGAALARKVSRRGPNLGQHLEQKFRKVPFRVMPVSLNERMVAGDSVVVEVPQGFSLSLNASGFYPYTTSRDCTLQQGLSDAGIHPRFFHKSMAVLRTLPIRVGNIVSDQGRQIGYSGHVYPDQREMSWAELGLPEERTTVTKRVRRIFSFSQKQYRDMLLYAMPDIVFVNFANYLNSTRMGNLVAGMQMTERSARVSPLHYYGYGKSSDDISEYVR